MEKEIAILRVRGEKVARDLNPAKIGNQRRVGLRRVVTAVRESDVVTAIRKEVLKRHPEAWVLKVHGGQYQTVGVPDLLVCVQGQLVGLEVKFQRPGESLFAAMGRATAWQQQQIGLINRAGGVAGVVTSPEQALALIDAALQRREESNGSRDHE